MDTVGCSAHIGPDSQRIMSGDTVVIAVATRCRHNIFLNHRRHNVFFKHYDDGQQ